MVPDLTLELGTGGKGDTEDTAERCGAGVMRLVLQSGTSPSGP